MHKRLKELGEHLAKLSAEMLGLTKAAEAENRVLSEDETQKLDTLEAEYSKHKAERDALEADRQRKARVADFAKDLGEPNQPLTSPVPLSRGDGINELDAALSRASRSSGQLRCFPDKKTAYLCGQWALAELFHKPAARDFLRRNAPEYLDMAGQQDAKGGVLVPHQFNQALIMLREEYGIARRKCDIATMTGDTASWPRWVSGVTTYFVGENASITESTPAFNQITLTARKMAALVQVPTELIEDAVIDIANLLADNIAYAFAVKEDQCLFLGTGTSTYGGIVGLITACAAATATVSTAATANTAFSTLDLADFEEMIGMLPAFPGIRPEWYISKVGWAASMMRLADAAGGVTSAEIAGGPSQTQFLGYPVNFVQCMNTTTDAQISTNGLCYFGDLRMAVTLGDRRAINVKTLTERYAEYDQIAVMGTERFDINVHDVGDTSKAGAVIMMATPSS